MDESDPDPTLRGWHLLFEPDAYDAVLAMSRFWQDRGFLCGLIAAGDPDGTAFAELARYDRPAAELAASTAITARHLAGEPT